MFYKDTEAEICKIFCDDILGINRDWEFKKNTTLCFENLYTQHEMCFLVKNYKILPSPNGKQTSQKATKIALVVITFLWDVISAITAWYEALMPSGWLQNYFHAMQTPN